MNIRPTNILAIALVLFSCSVTRAQSIRQIQSKPEISADTPAARAIAALQRLERQVIVYRSLGDFQETGRLANVDYSTFMRELAVVNSELGPILSRMPATKFRSELSNAFDAYRDGAFWWSKIDQRRVVNVSTLGYAESNPTPADAAFNSNMPYTVAIHWRQAAAYLKRAQQSQR